MNTKSRLLRSVLFFLVFLFALGVWALPTGAATVNVDAYSDGYNSPVELQLDAGTYTVTPVPGQYTAWSPWGSTTMWIYNYDMGLSG